MGVSEDDSFTYLDDLVDTAGTFQNYSAVSQLCIPPDSIDDVDLFPNFKDDFISFNFDCFPRNSNPDSSTGSNKQSWLLEEEVDGDDGFRGDFVNKKGRSKRGGGGRKWIEQKENVVPEVKCTHCKTEKTPQWRMGPLGPKTLCNACGMRYKSGRLLPEYRPAASPNFDCHKHSNFHKKIMKRKGMS